jgi:hypothetical protein
MKSMTTASVVAALLLACGCGASKGGSGGGALGGGGSGSAGSATGGSSGDGGAASSGGGPAASGGGGGQSESDCQSYCARAQTAGCAPANCLTACEQGEPECQSQSAAVAHCAAQKGTVTCNDGYPEVDGCDAAVSALAKCVAGACYGGKGACDPRLAGSCGGGQGCYWEPNDNYMFMCEAPGPNPLGGSCSFESRCAANLYCDDDTAGTCRTWCCQDSDCDAGQTCMFVAAGGAVNVRVCE